MQYQETPEGDEYLMERVKDHIVDLVSTTIMDWNDLQGIDDVKEALKSQYDDMLSMLDAKSEDEIEMDALLLHGEQGTGKISVAYSFAKKHGIQM
jgi:SpoVK/Ycf46/Vps4 family AAA+-type ATPase